MEPETNDERRIRKLRGLCDMHGRDKVAAIAKLNSQSLYQIIEGKVGAKMKKPKRVGDPMARKIEDRMALGRGWMDWPLDAVDHMRYYALNSIDQATVQGEMKHALRDCEVRSGKRDSA